MCGDVVVDVAHGLELCQLLVGHGHAAGILQGHVQLHGIQAVGLQILGQAGSIVTLSSSQFRVSTTIFFISSNVMVVFSFVLVV